MSLRKVCSCSHSQRYNDSPTRPVLHSVRESVGRILISLKAINILSDGDVKDKAKGDGKKKS